MDDNRKQYVTGAKVLQNTNYIHFHQNQLTGGCHCYNAKVGDALPAENVVSNVWQLLAQFAYATTLNKKELPKKLFFNKDSW